MRIRLRDGREVPADLLLVAAGVTPATDLARAAGLEVRRGVVVDEHLRTSDPWIFAVGDTVEWDGSVLGLWPIAVEQAEVAAENAVGGDRAYSQTVPMTILKVLGVELTSIGRVDADDSQGEREDVLVDSEALRYRKIVIDGEGRCVGAILLGFPAEAPAIAAAVKAHAPLQEALTRDYAPA